jgi:hypothetical protein
MADLDRLAVQVSDGLRNTMSRISTLTLGVTAIAASICIATFVTGLWILDSGRSAWVLIGGPLCAVPIGAALSARFYVRSTVKLASGLVGEVRTLLSNSRDAAKVLINRDAGEPLANTAKRFSTLRYYLKERRWDLPALFAGVRAITIVPALVAIALLGSLAVGVLGTILMIGALID